MQVHDFSHYPLPDDSEAEATSEFCQQLEEISECWNGIILGQIERNWMFRAYFETILMLCEGQATQ
jgi:hypothetical protein